MPLRLVPAACCSKAATEQVHACMRACAHPLHIGPRTLTLSRSIWPLSGPHTGLWNWHSPAAAGTSGSSQATIGAGSPQGSPHRPVPFLPRHPKGAGTQHGRPAWWLQPVRKPRRCPRRAACAPAAAPPPAKPAPVMTRRQECAPCGVATHCMWLAKAEAKGTPSESHRPRSTKPPALRCTASSTSAAWGRAGQQQAGAQVGPAGRESTGTRPAGMPLGQGSRGRARAARSHAARLSAVQSWWLADILRPATASPAAAAPVLNACRGPSAFLSGVV